MHRSDFLKQTAAVLLALPLSSWLGHQPVPQFITVDGPVAAGKLGWILVHEHLLVDFIGADKVSSDRYQPQQVIEVMLPFVRAAKAAGCTALFDCTPAYLGRDVQLLQKIAKAAGLPIITNTGYYSAAGHKYLPAHARTESAETLAARWIKEFEKGIDGTGIRPGFIKISVDRDPLDALNKKIVRAAAITHKATGLTIGSHTGSGKAALEQLDILEAEGVASKAFVWIHAQNERDRSLQQAAAMRGAWIEFDNLGWEPAPVFLEHIRFMEAAGLLGQLLVSHDAGWYDVVQQGKNEIKPFTPMFTQLVPALQQEGWTTARIDQLLHHNPVKAFHLHKRLLASN